MALDPSDHLGLAFGLAGRYRDLPDPDAVKGAALLALTKACPGFDPQRGTTASTYLHPFLLGACRSEVAKQLRRREVGLYVLTDDGEERERPDLPPVLPTAERDAAGREVREAVAALPEREARIIRACYGLDGSAPLTCMDVAEREGLSRQRVQQLRAKAEARLRRRLTPRRLKKSGAGTARS